MINGHRVLDAFLFWNELDLLELRLRELDDLVDEWLVVQSPETHAGTPKPILFDPTDERWKPWFGRIWSAVIPCAPAEYTRVERERFGRIMLTKEVRDLDQFDSDDFILYGDLDEIPDKAVVRQMAPKVDGDLWVGFRPRLYSYYLNFRSPQAWSAIALANLGAFLSIGGEVIRDRRKCPPVAVRRGVGGWHFSWLGGVEAIQAKIRAWMHEEFDTEEIRNPERIARRIAEGKELFDTRGGRYYQVSIGEMPTEVRTHPDRYRRWLLPEREAA